MTALAFCDDWDRALFEAEVLALFLRDPDGELRLQPDRTRDALRHAPGPFPRVPVHALLRDRATGHVHCVLATSPGLLEGHPRLEARVYDSEAAALAALAALGPAAVAPDGLP
jgi:hypothetical protein